MQSRRCIFVLLPVVLAACGSTSARDDRPAASAPAPRASSFRAEARRACAPLHRRLERLDKASLPPNRVLVVVADEWDAAVTRLRRLDPPARDEGRFARMLVHFGHAIRAARAVPTAKDEMVLAAMAGMLDQGGKGATIAQSLGLLSCTAVPPAPTREEVARWEQHMKRAARKHFAQLRLDQAAHPRRIGPRVKPATRP